MYSKMSFLYYFITLDLVIYLNLEKSVSAQTGIYSFRKVVLSDIRLIRLSRNNINYYRIKFNAYDKTFKFRLYRENSLFSSAAKIYTYRKNKILRLHLSNLESASIYTGKNKDGSTVFGYIYRKMFIGRIDTKEQVYFIEPAIHYSQFGESNKTIIYTGEQVYINSSFRDIKYNCEEINKESLLAQNYQLNIYRYTKSLKDISTVSREKLTKKGPSCSLELLADHTYFEFMDKDHERIIAEMLFYAMTAHMIFRRADLNNDGKSNEIGFNVEKITIFESENIQGYPLQNVKRDDFDSFMNHISQYKHPYCMLIHFCYRDFWIKSHCAVKKFNRIGGICDLTSLHEVSSNIAFVSYIERDFRIPAIRIALNLLHQLGHAFGCEDDPLNDEFCSPEDVNRSNGNFIMYPTVPFGHHLNNWNFSICCLHAMQKIITKKDKCLNRVKQATCGNEIIEEGETCDCNYSTGICKNAKDCCISKGSPSECSLRPKTLCAPAIGQCCDNNCHFISYNKTCFSNVICFNATSYCDGSSSFCSGVMESDGSPCLNTFQTCRRGLCISNVCEDHGLELCQCSTIEKECHFCCKNHSGNCNTVESFNIFNSKKQLYLKSEGTECNGKRGICLRNGTCWIKSSKKILDYRLWYYLSPIPFIISAILGMYFMTDRNLRSPSVVTMATKYQLRKDRLRGIRKGHSIKLHQYDNREKQKVFDKIVEMQGRNVTEEASLKMEKQNMFEKNKESRSTERD
ncbi:disintegrin and metalloproteinase domain-containing protein 10-like [Centruroides sculpturatus]|uniref:disintegrin and metalloproteinase domain-containing protein 10-like n=1 Tax=Centruroides sculpturatus TaxID=218467 RepID=UPI000C6E85BD|nr:disintegrin and metalloproteinase domain-containing protein 10-like [Centruroides sculpturatus]